MKPRRIELPAVPMGLQRGARLSGAEVSAGWPPPDDQRGLYINGASFGGRPFQRQEPEPDLGEVIADAVLDARWQHMISGPIEAAVRAVARAEIARRAKLS
jgi:hypothetical protein